MRVLVVNPGSSSLKVSVLEPPAVESLSTAEIDWVMAREDVVIARSVASLLGSASAADDL